MAKKKLTKSTDEILTILCQGIKETLETTTGSQIYYSPTFIKTNKTCLRPDIGCFVLFEGGFSGLVAMNFSAEAALEIYTKYNLNMGMPKEDLARHHTSNEVADAMGELMNQCIGKFRQLLKNAVGVGVNQTQPKMVALNQAMKLSLEADLDRPQFRRVEMKTQDHKFFYLEITLEKVEFIYQDPAMSEDSMGNGSAENNESPEELMKKLGL
ncbi:DUF3334 family protein [Desulfonatronovibrio hydrogenovorans]|uniref:DUF3334 family protein n=1 Tax=Desulfonatronovibrio hydrogenovorans TaxID=53245 RepID=UPI0004913EA5|nr:DUF3334 family protein [Desulfonatronovibrio hydrogenovorans]